MSEEFTVSVTDVVNATRCPRQYVLAGLGTRVVPYGTDAFGQAAHVALRAMTVGAATDARLHELLGRALPDRPAVEQALVRLAYGEAFAYAKKVASTIDGGDLARFADTIRKIAGTLTPPLAKAAGQATSGKEAVAKVFLASEEAIEIPLENVTIRGRIDLLCRDSGETWIWDLKTYAGTDDAQLEQVRLYAMAYAARGIQARPALLHVVRDRIQFSHADPPKEGDAQKLETLAAHMREWRDGTPPPPPPDLGTCRTCPAQSTCWRTWNRTLPDEVDEMPRRPSVATPPVAVVPEAAATEPTLAPPVEFAVAEPLPAMPYVKPTPTAPPVVAAAGEPEPLWPGNDMKKNPVRIQPMEITRHIAVFGAAGSGKTYFAKTIVEEAVLAGIPVLAFDVQGDMLTLAKVLDDDQVEPAIRGRRDRYRERADVRLLTPVSDAGLGVSLNPLRFPKGEMSVEHATVYSEVVAENLLAHVKLAPSWRDHAKAYLAQRIRTEMKNVTSLTIEELIMSIASDEDIDDPLIDATQRTKLVKELRLLTVGSKSLLFKIGRPLDLDVLLTVRDPKKTPLNILYLNGLGDQNNKASFVAMVLADLYAWMLRQKGGVPRVLLYFDEIGPYMPPNGEPVAKKLLKQIFKEGRKYGVCGLFCTQNFTDVDYKVVSQASTVAIGRLNAVQEKKKAAESLGQPAGFDVEAAVDALIRSPSGRFIMKRVDGPPHWITGRKLVTLHGPTWGEEEIRAHTTDAQREEWKREG